MLYLPPSLVADTRLVITRGFAFGGYLLYIFAKSRHDVAPTCVIKSRDLQSLSDYLQAHHLGEPVLWYVPYLKPQPTVV